MIISLAAVRAVLWRSALFALLWWALTDGRVDSWGLGSVSILAAAILSLHLLPPVSTYVSRVGRLRFVVFFFVPSLRGGVQVAWLALRPRFSLRPDIHGIRAQDFGPAFVSVALSRTQPAQEHPLCLSACRFARQ